jgi:thermitase
MAILWALLAAVALQPTIAVVDTGANLRAPAITASYDVRTHSRDVRDPNGHGTRVTSAILRQDPAARVLVIRAGSSSGAFTNANEAAAIRYAVDHGARIVNLSLGGSSTSSAERAAVRYAIAHGVLLVAAAGDDYAPRPEYPAALLGRDGLAVASVLADGTPADFSNSGPWVGIAAPGEDGTSFAAPVVAAAAAEVWAANPKLHARDVVAVLEATASLHGARTNKVGFGVLDVAAAVARASY